MFETLIIAAIMSVISAVAGIRFGFDRGFMAGQAYATLAIAIGEVTKRRKASAKVTEPEHETSL